MLSQFILGFHEEIVRGRSGENADGDDHYELEKKDLRNFKAND